MDQKYLDELRRRGKESHVYRKYQLLGLEIAKILDDEKHKALYIKLAKEGVPDELMALAKRIAENKEVKNRGAYFMTLVANLRKETKARKNQETKKNGGKNFNGSR